MIYTARLSKDGKYRYSLGRRWGTDYGPMLLFIMLNPSTADASFDDPTINKCIGFAKKWKFAGIHVCNLFAYRATDPLEMKKVIDPVGWENTGTILEYVDKCHSIVCAWGNHGSHMDQGNKILTLIRNQIGRQKKLWCFQKNKSGEPKHPLYIPYSKSLIEL